MLARFEDRFKIGFRRKPGVKEHVAKFQPIIDAGFEHVPDSLVFRHLAGSFVLAGCHVAILDRFANDLEGHRDRDLTVVVQGIQQVDSLDRAPLAGVVVPAHNLVFVRPVFLLDRVVKNEITVLLLQRAAIPA